MEQKSILECPFCGAKPVNKDEFIKRTGMEIERTIKWNGEASIILRLGELVMEGQKRTGQDMLDKQKIFDLLKEEHKRLDERQKELEENRKNIVKEQKETFEEIAKQRKELEEKRKQIEESAKKQMEEIMAKKEELEGGAEKQMAEIMAEKEELHNLKEEILKAEQIKMPEEVLKQLKEIEKIAGERHMKTEELLTKIIYTAKSSGTLQETLLLRRLKALNTGDKIEHLGGPDQEDVLISVIEAGKELGKIRIDSKKVEKWDDKFIEKMRKYLKENSLDFGVIATTTMPKNAAGGDFHWEENILIVNARVIECAYLTGRYLIKKSNQYAHEQEKHLNLMEENEKKFEIVRKVLENSNTRKFLTAICHEVEKSNKTLDDFDNYTEKALKGLRKCNTSIAKQVENALDSNENLQKALSGA